MNLNSAATATISFSGLGLLCVNDNQECEVGILDCQGHTLELDILQISADSETGVPRSIGLLRPLKSTS